MQTTEANHPDEIDRTALAQALDLDPDQITSLTIDVQPLEATVTWTGHRRITHHDLARILEAASR